MPRCYPAPPVTVTPAAGMGGRQAEAGEQAGIAEYHDPADARGGRGEHNDGVCAVDAVAAATVGVRGGGARGEVAEKNSRAGTGFPCRLGGGCLGVMNPRLRSGVRRVVWVPAP